MQNAKLDEAQGGIKIAGRNINNLWKMNSKNINNNSAIISFILWEKESHKLLPYNVSKYAKAYSSFSLII